ncbi:hypothetical protein [Limosilactobacillus fermentum]
MTMPVADVNAPEVLEADAGIDAYQALQGQLTAVQSVRHQATGQGFDGGGGRLRRQPGPL